MKKIVWFFRHLCLWLSIAAVFMLAKYATPPAQATVFTRTIVLNDSLTIKAAFLDGVSTHTYNNGASIVSNYEKLYVGSTASLGEAAYVGLFKFPTIYDSIIALNAVSTKQDCSLIIACTLSVYVIGDVIGTGDTMVIGASGIEVAKIWGEGNKAGSAAAVGECSWHNAATDPEGPPPEGTAILWGAAGCRGTADTIGVKAGDTTAWIPSDVTLGTLFKIKIDTSLANFWRLHDTCNGVALDGFRRFGAGMPGVNTYVFICGPQTSNASFLAYVPVLTMTYITKDSVAAAAPTGARRRIMENLQ